MQPNGSPVTAVAVMQPQAVAVQQQEQSLYMPAMSMQLALARRNAIVEFTRQIMVKDHDFGEIPGTNKPTLLKPGAEKLCSFFGFEPHFEISAETKDWTGATTGGEPLYYIAYKCRLMKNGIVLGVGEGSCNSWEQKYRYRWVAENMLPPGVDKKALLSRGGMKVCTEFDFAIEKAETGGKYGKPAEYWQAFRAAIENKTAKRGEKEMKGGRKGLVWSIEIGQTEYRIANPEFADLINTIQKMAQKRALVAATLIATNASEFYTQDVEDMPRDDSAEIGRQYGVEPGTQAAADAVAAKKIADAPPPATNTATADPEQWRKNFQGLMNDALELLGEQRFMDVLQAASRALSEETNKAVEIRGLSDISDKKTANFVWAKHMSPAMDAEKARRAAEPAEAIVVDDREDWVPDNIGGADGDLALPGGAQQHRLSSLQTACCTPDTPATWKLRGAIAALRRVLEGAKR